MPIGILGQMRIEERKETKLGEKRDKIGKEKRQNKEEGSELDTRKYSEKVEG